MPDFSSTEKTDAVSPLSENPFAHLPITFLLKPLLIMGRAMEYYGLRPDDEAHFLVPKPEFERLWAAIPEGHVTTIQNEKGVRLGNTVFSVKLLGCSYYDLEVEAMEERDYFVVHIEFLLYLNTLTLIHHPENQQARQDVLLLLERLGVLTPAQNAVPLTTEEVSEERTSLDATFEVVKTITVTRLSPEVISMLRQQGCIVDERGLANVLVTFPEQTRRQPLLPPTAIERSRIVLASGLELRHQIDQEREMSLLAVVRSQTAQRGYDERLHQ
jgi:hypothetical protein